MKTILPVPPIAELPIYALPLRSNVIDCTAVPLLPDDMALELRYRPVLLPPPGTLPELYDTEYENGIPLGSVCLKSYVKELVPEVVSPI